MRSLKGLWIPEQVPIIKGVLIYFWAHPRFNLMWMTDDNIDTQSNELKERKNYTIVFTLLNAVLSELLHLYTKFCENYD